MKTVRKILALGSVGLLMVAFQNCGQPGQLISAAPEGETVISNGLVIDPVPSTDSEQPPVVSMPPTSESDPYPVIPPSSDDNKKKKGPSCGCDHLKAADVQLNIHQIMTGNLEALEITDLDQSVSIEKTKLQVKALISTDLKEIRLVLNDSGNFLMSEDQSVHDLKTPSAQSSGFKIKFTKPVSVVAGVTYELDLNLDLDKQIVSAGKKCILKPVVKSGVLNPL